MPNGFALERPNCDSILNKLCTDLVGAPPDQADTMSLRVF
jgi:hypothetical protein